MEVTSIARDGRVSISSRSDSSDSESMTKSHSSHRNFPSRRYFMSNPVHPLSIPSGTPKRGVFGFSPFRSSTPLREKHRFSSASCSVDHWEEATDPPAETDGLTSRSLNVSDSPIKCGLCDRFLSQRSPWSSKRIVRTSDMPVAGVLSCRHVFHAECLDQTTPKARKSDPPCPVCARLEEGSSPGQRTGFLKLSGPSKPWGCALAGDCVEGSRNTILSLNRNRIRKSLSLKANLGKEFPGKFRKTDSPCSSQWFVESMDHATT
ncbi:unnamed protein product [Cuscuta epithymum]|uniref:RING-type domain-containing protein n=1 Tax=Cuscuta epithymum TaxID=186058 RepID=A0AAV0DFU3_9ASTE|nr:unnamed protein product [Cuscuta epithymum]